MKKTIVMVVTATSMLVFTNLAFISQAGAGNGILHDSSGKKVRVNCNGSGCSAIYYNKDGKRTGKKTGPGGRSNYLKLVKKLRAKGYK